MTEPDGPGHPTSRQWFLVWLKIGISSFGGGVTTIALIRQELVERNRWVTNEEYLRDFALCQLTPGVNIIAMTVIFGRRVVGPRGVVLAVAGLLLPSAAATAAITAAYASAKQSEAVKAALRCVLPAVAGLGIATAVQLALPPLRLSWSERGASLLVALALIGLPALAVAVMHCPTVVGLAGGAVLGAAWVFARHRRPMPG